MIGWSDFNFLQFLKIGTLLSIGYIFMSSKPNNWRILPCARVAQALQSVHFLKITGTLKMNIFFKVCKNLSFYIKEQMSTRKFKIRICLEFCFIFQNWRKRLLT